MLSDERGARAAHEELPQLLARAHALHLPCASAHTRPQTSPTNTGEPALATPTPHALFTGVSALTCAQGMNFVAALLLLALDRDPEAAFWVLAALIEDRLYKGVWLQAPAPGACTRPDRRSGGRGLMSCRDARAVRQCCGLRPCGLSDDALAHVLLAGRRPVLIPPCALHG